MSNLIINAVSNNTKVSQPQVNKSETEEQKPKHEFSTTEKVIGGLSALALLGTGIYFAVRHGKVSANKFKTIVKKDGSMERLFPNGNTVNIRTVKNPNGWSRTITVTDSNGKKICERHKSLGKHSDYSIFDVETKRAYNSEGNETINIWKNVYKTKDKTEIKTNEYYYNEKGHSLDDTNLLKQKLESKTIDKDGKLIAESSDLKELNKFGSFDEHEYRMYLPKEKEGVIRTSTTHVEHTENNIEKINYTTEDVDANGNRLWDNQQLIIEDKNKNIAERTTHNYHYIIDNQGKPTLKNNSYYSKETYPLNDKNDYISHYNKKFSTGKGQSHAGQTLYEITDYTRNENGVGLLKRYWEDLEGKVIEGSLKQKQGKDVKWDTIILD